MRPDQTTPDQNKPELLFHKMQTPISGAANPVTWDNSCWHKRIVDWSNPGAGVDWGEYKGFEQWRDRCCWNQHKTWQSFGENQESCLNSSYKPSSTWVNFRTSGIADNEKTAVDGSRWFLRTDTRRLHTTRKRGGNARKADSYPTNSQHWHKWVLTWARGGVQNICFDALLFLKIIAERTCSFEPNNLFAPPSLIVQSLSWQTESRNG